MFGVDLSEFLIVAIAALLFIGPKELPGAMRSIGRLIGKMRGMARHFTSGVESIIREAELEEMESKWRDENERIMRDYPALESEIAGEEGDGEQAALPFEPPTEKRELP